MMDERIIMEVQKHGIIYNRQRSNAVNGADKCVTKELAWTHIARNLGTDVDTCKKRWKYLRERYVQQKKVGDSPTYEHLSRPYLEKMKFLDSFIQPRKSYRNVAHFLASPSGSGQMKEYDDDTSAGMTNCSDSTIAYQQFYLAQQQQQQQATLTGGTGNIKEEDVEQNGVPPTNIQQQQLMQNFASMQQDIQLKQQQQQQQHQQQQQQHIHIQQKQQQQLQQHFAMQQPPDLIKAETATRFSSSSSAASQSSPIAGDLLDTQKRRRTSIMVDKSDTEEQSSTNNETASDNRGLTFPSDFLYTFYQNAHRPVRNSEQLLGELVTSELLKMANDRKKLVQKKILEILFFDE